MQKISILVGKCRVHHFAPTFITTSNHKRVSVSQDRQDLRFLQCSSSKIYANQICHNTIDAYVIRTDKGNYSISQ